MKAIPLTQGREALVDDEDYDYLMQWKWHVVSGKYAGRDVRRKGHTTGNYAYMHVVVAERAGHEACEDVDHRDGNGFNNQRYNLRPSQHQQNLCNRGPQRNNTSGFKGVTWDKARQQWKAQIKLHQKQQWIGRFETPEAAAQAYDDAAKKHFGEFAYLNFP